MRKKIVGIFVCMMLVLTNVFLTVNSEENFTDNESFVLIDNETDCGFGVINTDKTGYDLNEIKLKLLELDEPSKKPIPINTPDYFNWMDYEQKDWTTSAKDQHPCGSCFVFAAFGALESIISIREGRADLDLDLSEQYVLSCLPRSGDCTGGSAFNTYYYILSNQSSGNYCNGIIPESYFPYKSIDMFGFNGENYDNDPVLCDEKFDNWEDFLIPISDCGYWYPKGSPEDIDLIKSQIMQHGPVVTSMTATWYLQGEGNFVDWGWNHHDSDDYFSNPKEYPIIVHCVVIVGWKDDPEISNGGYWICKNSWGQEFGYDGFFNIEYGTERIDSSIIEWVEYNPEVFVNWEPVAEAGDILYGDVGEELIFDGSSSFDHEGEIVSYFWDFGDGYNEYGITVFHTYESQGVYPVTLTIVDNSGNMVNDTTWAFIGRSNDPPDTPTISGPLEGKIDIDYDFNFSSKDPDGDDIYYYVYWGDNWPIWNGPFPSGKEIKLNHTWTSKLPYTICVKARDEYGFKSNWSSIEFTIPKNKLFHHKFNFVSWLYEQIPFAFPLLKFLFKLSPEGNGEKSLLVGS